MTEKAFSKIAAGLQEAIDMTNRCEPPPHLRGTEGWHWLRWHEYSPGNEFIAFWDAGSWDSETDYLNYDDGRRYIYVAPVATHAEVAALRAELDRRGHEIASLRVTLRQMPPTAGAEPIGCPTPGACSAVAASAALVGALEHIQVAAQVGMPEYSAADIEDMARAALVKYRRETP